MTSLSPAQRLYSLDALRGFDMFWIMGAEDIVHSLAETTGSPFFKALAAELTHPEWHGFTFYDLIFPLFLFMAGVSTPFSIENAIEKGTPKNKLLIRVIRRGLILVALGVFYNNGLSLHAFREIRFASVLGRIGLAYMFAAIIYLYNHNKERNLIYWFSGLLVGYWLLLRFSSAPGHPMGDLSMEGNVASYLDHLILPGRLYKGIHDPEGLVSTIPAIGTGLLGIYAGIQLRHHQRTPLQKALRLTVIGIAFLAVAQLWNIFFPINKNLWTSSFVLHVGGLSLLLLAFFYYIIDGLGYKRWAFFFTVIGMNSILIYVSWRIIDWQYATEGIFKWLIQWTGDPYNIVVAAICLVIVKWTFLYIVYRKNIFLRV